MFKFIREETESPAKTTTALNGGYEQTPPIEGPKSRLLIARKVDPPQAQMKILISPIYSWVRLPPQSPASSQVIRSNHSAVFSPPLICF